MNSYGGEGGKRIDRGRGRRGVGESKERAESVRGNVLNEAE